MVSTSMVQEMGTGMFAVWVESCKIAISRRALPIHLFRHFCFRMFCLARPTMHSVIDRQTDRQHHHANSRSSTIGWNIKSVKYDVIYIRPVIIDMTFARFSRALDHVILSRNSIWSVAASASCSIEPSARSMPFIPPHWLSALLQQMPAITVYKWRALN